MNLRIKELRKKNNLSQKEFSDKIGIDNSQLSKIERGILTPTISQVIDISNKFNVSIDWLLKNEGKNGANVIQQLTLNMSGVTKDDYQYLDDSTIEIFTNSNGNKFYLYPNGRIEIEVEKVPFKAYASYIECYQDDVKTMNNVFDTIRFKADHIAKGNYKCFVSEGDSMNGGMLDDTPGGSEILAREIGRQLWDGLHNTKYGLIFVTKTGIMHKDFGGYNEETGMFTLMSRNKAHKPFEYPANDVYQIFNVIKRSF